MKRVVITDFINDTLAIEREVLDGVATVEAIDALAEQDLRGRVESADAVMMYHNLSVNAATIESLTNCKLIVRCGVGFDNVDHAVARQRGIPVSNVPDYGTEEVADSAIGMMLTLARGIHQYNVRLQYDGDPWSYTIAQPLKRLRGAVFGIVGLGRIGIAAARRAAAIGMDVAFYDPFREDGFDKAIGVRRVETLKELIEQSHVLSIHCPLNDDSHQIINSKTIEWMPKGSYLINTGRGDVVDTDIIPGAIASGRLAGAGIDVLATEPPDPADPLIAAWRDPIHPAHERLIINPHAAFYCEQGLEDMRRKGAQACRNALTGVPVRNVIN